MNGEKFASVWDAIENTPAEAENMKLRSSLMMALEQHIKAQGWTQKEAGERLGVTQPRVSDLMRGKIGLFGIDTLINMATAAGICAAQSNRAATTRQARAGMTVTVQEPSMASQCYT
ncbi:MAG: XRE family transcriptional regulator, partial [Rhodospirillaceae bacterium]